MSVFDFLDKIQCVDRKLLLLFEWKEVILLVATQIEGVETRVQDWWITSHGIRLVVYR